MICDHWREHCDAKTLFICLHNDKNKTYVEDFKLENTITNATDIYCTSVSCMTPEKQKSHMRAIFKIKVCLFTYNTGVSYFHQIVQKTVLLCKHGERQL